MGERSSLWRRRKLRLLSWATLFVTTLVMILLEVPGLNVKPTLLRPTMPEGGASAWVPGPGPECVTECTHGWPLCYLRRAWGTGGDGWPAHPKAWKNYSYSPF